MEHLTYSGLTSAPSLKNYTHSLKVGWPKIVSVQTFGQPGGDSPVRDKQWQSLSECVTDCLPRTY